MAAGMRYGYARAMWNISGLQLGILFVLADRRRGPRRDHRGVDDRVRRRSSGSASAYLVYLGIQQWRAPAAPMHATRARDVSATRRAQLVLRGFLVNATNPKGIVFMLAVLPQFIDPALPQLPQYVVCGATLFFTDLVVMSGYTGLAAKVLRLLREPRHVRWINRTFGGLFVAAGAVLATFRRAA